MAGVQARGSVATGGRALFVALAVALTLPAGAQPATITVTDDDGDAAGNELAGGAGDERPGVRDEEGDSLICMR